MFQPCLRDGQFSLLTCVAKRDQMMPVAVTASCCGYDTFSAGRCMSARLAMLIPHLKVGACT